MPDVGEARQQARSGNLDPMSIGGAGGPPALPGANAARADVLSPIVIELNPAR